MLSAVDLGVDARTPADRDWDEARRAWNLAVDQHPEAVAYPQGAGDVARVVAAAREHGLRVAVQATGHGAPARGSLEGAILVRTDRMRRVSVDPVARTARVEAGAQWQDLVPVAASHGLAGLAGSAPDIGIVGYTLGGGTGWLGRRHGLACNSVRALEVVTADGRCVRADAEGERDLFWALRGGGGSFGVVTALEFELQPVESLYAGVLMWPWERAGDVLHAWREWTATVPDEMTSIGRILQLPPLPTIPEPLRGRSFVVVEAAYLGPEAEGAELLAPLRALGPEMDTVATMPPTLLHTLHNDPPQPVPGAGDGALLRELPAEAVDAFVAATGPGSGSPFVGAEIRHFGGALGRTPEGAGALDRIDASYGTFCVGIAATPKLQARVVEHLDRTDEALAPWTADRVLMNLKDRRTEPRRLFGSAAGRLLRQIRDQVDPDGMFQPNHPIG